MEDSVYTIKNLCDELNEPRQKVRRRLEKLEIKAINEDTRAYKNDPLKYDHQSFLKLAEEFDVQIRDKEFMSSVQHRTTEWSAIIKVQTQNTQNLIEYFKRGVLQ